MSQQQFSSPSSSPPPSSPSSATDGEPPKQWLMDRINGTSKYGERDRPDCPCCYVPPPVGWCPGVLETNWVCQTWGWLGCCGSERARSTMLHLGFFANICGCILTIYACLSISEDFDVLQKTSMGHLDITAVNGEFDDVITGDMGLRAAALDNPISGAGPVVVPFDQFCDLRDDGLQQYMSPEDCAACQDSSSNMVISLIIATVTFLPSFFTDINRMYSGYDVNCQKCFATVFAFFTVLLSLNTFFTYIYLCGTKFYEGIIPFDANGNALPPDTPEEEVAIYMNFEWKLGWGGIMLLVGTSLKFIDIFFNLCIKTPNVTRDLHEQQIYEKIKDDDF